jgi:hypothetical protein
VTLFPQEDDSDARSAEERRPSGTSTPPTAGTEGRESSTPFVVGEHGIGSCEGNIYEGRRALAVGSYAFDFFFELPPNVPGSFAVDFGGPTASIISHQLAAEVHFRRHATEGAESKCECKHNLVVYQPPPSDAIQSAANSAVSRQFSIANGKAITLTFERSTFHNGNDVMRWTSDGESITSSSSTSLPFIISLQQLVKFSVGSEVRHRCQEVAAANNDVRDSSVSPAELTIPSGTPRSYESDLVSCKYEIQVRSITDGTILCSSIPVTIYDYIPVVAEAAAATATAPDMKH